MKLLGCLLLTVGILGVAFAAGPDPGEVDFLRRQYAYLQSLPPARQQQIRTLDAELNALDQETQDRLRKVMANFNYWLAHLPEDDRNRVVEAPTANAKLKIIGELKDREWLETLPKAYREKYAKATHADRFRLLDGWREDERLRRDEWQFVRQNWKEFQDEASPPLIPQGLEFRKELDTFVQNLESQLTQEQRDRLHRVRGMVQDQRASISYLKLVVELADRNPLLPGPQDGPRNFEALPRADIVALERNKKKQFNQLQNAQGRWPEYAIAVTNYAAKHAISLPRPLGPTNKALMPAEVKTFIEKELEPTLRKFESMDRTDNDKKEKAEHAQRDLVRLHEAEGKWPEYPRAVMDLARSYKLYMPGWMLPGKQEFWDRFRTLKRK